MDNFYKEYIIYDKSDYLKFYPHISAFFIDFNLPSICVIVMKALTLLFVKVSIIITFIIILLYVAIGLLTFDLELF